ncbi:MAG: 50S ribosomal protein L11 [Pseudomonadota bacterium]
MSKAKKKVKLSKFKMHIPAGKATPAPPIGSALGQRGLNIPGFCKEFNDKSSTYDAGAPLPVTILYNTKDKSFEMFIKAPTVSYLLKKAANIKKGAKETGKEIIGKIKLSEIEKIVDVKMQDLNAYNKEAASKMIIGSAVSMGLEVIDGE